jgi:hypothetical protein
VEVDQSAGEFAFGQNLNVIDKATKGLKRFNLVFIVIFNNHDPETVILAKRIMFYVKFYRTFLLS